MKVLEFKKKPKSSYKKAVAEQQGNTKSRVELVDWYNRNLQELHEMFINRDSERDVLDMQVVTVRLLAEVYVGLNVENQSISENALIEFLTQSVNKVMQEHLNGENRNFT